ncbi:hypothetical protein Hanom_Chr03g00190961 [Helianthus anomalus]
MENWRVHTSYISSCSQSLGGSCLPLAEVYYVEGKDCGELLDSTLTDTVSGVKRIAKIKHLWGQDNRELHQARQAVLQMTDNLQWRDSLLDAAKVLDCQEKERMISHALKTQKELERKVVMEPKKVCALSSQVAMLRIDHEFVSQVQECHTTLMADMEDTQSRCEQANQKCDELVVQRTRLQHDLETKRSRCVE